MENELKAVSSTVFMSTANGVQEERRKLHLEAAERVLLVSPR